MSINYWWHNVSKSIWNESDLGDFIDEVEQGDIILFSESGNALLNSIELPNINKHELTNEYSHVRKEFHDRYFEAYNKPFK